MQIKKRYRKTSDFWKKVGEEVGHSNEQTERLFKNLAAEYQKIKLGSHLSGATTETPVLSGLEELFAAYEQFYTLYFPQCRTKYCSDRTLADLHSVSCQCVYNKKARKIVSHFKHSEQARQKFCDVQKSCEVPEHKLIQDVKQGGIAPIWCLNVWQQRKAVNLFSVEQGGIDTLSPTEWQLAERIVEVLKPFYQATMEISSDDACGSTC